MRDKHKIEYKIDDKTIEFGAMMNLRSLCAYIALGQKGADKFAQQAGAKVRIGGRVLYIRSRIDDAIAML